MDIFVETMRWFVLRTRLQAGNAFNRTFLRDRWVYTGGLELTPWRSGNCVGARGDTLSDCP